MEYLKVRWIHEHPDEPVLLMSELDDDRYEVRKVEVFADGQSEFASEDRSSSDRTGLGEVPIPLESEIAEDPQFVVQHIDADGFETAWIAAVQSAG